MLRIPARNVYPRQARPALYIHNYYGTPTPHPAAHSLSLGVPSPVSGRGSIYDFILFIKCSSFSLFPSPPSPSSSATMSMMIFTIFCVHLSHSLGPRGRSRGPKEPVGHSRHSILALSISGVMTNAVCNYCIYSVSALIVQQDSLAPYASQPPLPLPHATSCHTCLMPQRNGKKISEMSHINNAPDGGTFRVLRFVP